jgi:hypothetical protein
MTRNPYARSLRIHAQRVVPDKREATMRKLWNEEVERGLLPDEKELLDKLK